MIIQMSGRQRDELILATAVAVRALIEHARGYPINCATYMPARITEAYVDLDRAIRAIEQVENEGR